MKKMIYITILSLILLAQNSFSQQSGDLNGIYYQAVALDDDGKEIVGMDIDGKPLYNKTIAVKFTITAGLDGSILWEEVHTTNTDKYGLFTLVIGQGEITSTSAFDDLIDIPWIDANQFLKVEISTKNDGNFKLVSNQQFMAVPYSFYADDIADNSVTTFKILDSAIENRDLQTGSVNSRTILDGTIVNEDIADGTVDLKTKVTDVLPVVNGGTGKDLFTEGNILVGAGNLPLSAKKLCSKDSSILITQTADSIILKAQFATTEVTSDPAGTFNMGTLDPGETYISNAINMFDVGFGDIIIGSINKDLSGCILTAYVSEPNVIRISVYNPTSNPVTFNFVEVRVVIVN